MRTRTAQEAGLYWAIRGGLSFPSSISGVGWQRYQFLLFFFQYHIHSFSCSHSCPLAGCVHDSSVYCHTTKSRGLQRFWSKWHVKWMYVVLQPRRPEDLILPVTSPRNSSQSPALSPCRFVLLRRGNNGNSKAEIPPALRLSACQRPPWSFSFLSKPLSYNSVFSIPGGLPSEQRPY